MKTMHDNKPALWIRMKLASSITGFSRVIILKWSTNGCPALGGRKIKRKPIHRGSREKFYYSPDLMKASQRDGKPVEQFEDASGRWLWVHRLKSRGFHFSILTIRQWHEGGCPFLGGRKIRLILKRFDGVKTSRLFALESELMEIIVLRQTSTDRADGWTGLSDAAARGLPKNFTWQWRRLSHLFLGRPIRSRKRFRGSGSKTLEIVELWTGDLDLISARRREFAHRPGRLNAHQAFDRFQIHPATLTTLRKGRKITANFEIGLRRNGLPSKMWFFNEAELAKYVSDRDGRRRRGSIRIRRKSLKPRKDRSRERGPATDPKSDRRIASAWATGSYKTKADLAAMMGITVEETSAAIHRDRSRQ